jgi:hypothetical protein
MSARNLFLIEGNINYRDIYIEVGKLFLRGLWFVIKGIVNKIIRC